MSDSFLTTLDFAVKTRLFYKIKNHLGITDLNTDCVVWPKEYALRKMSEKRGADSVEFFNLWRTSVVKSMGRERTSVATTGLNLGRPDGSGIYNLRLIPVDTFYSMWVWSESKNVINVLEEQFLFWVYKNPKLNLKIDDFPVSFAVHPIQTSYEVMDPYNKGLVYVLQCDFQVDAWVLDPDSNFNENVPRITRIQLDVAESDIPLFVDVWEGKAASIHDSGLGEDVVTRSII